MAERITCLQGRSAQQVAIKQVVSDMMQVPGQSGIFTKKSANAEVICHITKCPFKVLVSLEGKPVTYKVGDDRVIRYSARRQDMVTTTTDVCMFKR